MVARAALMSFMFKDEESCKNAIEDIRSHLYDYGTISLSEIAEIAKDYDADCADIRMGLGYENKVGFDHRIMPTLLPGRQQITDGYCWFITYDSYAESFLN